MMSAPNQFHLRWRGQVSGPFTREAVLQKLDDHEISVWHEVQHGGAWMSLEEFLQRERKDKQRAAADAAVPVDSGPRASTPPPVPVVFSKPVANSKFRPKKMKWFAALGLALGFTGAHNFYAGYWGTAIAQLLLTVVTVALGFGIFAAWLWAMIELLLVHTDQRGVRMI
jgi:TM2 domain-containing membrane protein YozV